jgi:hypothetical protein
MNAFWQTVRVVTQAARQKRIFWACVRQPANDVRQDGPAAVAVGTSVVAASITARAIRTEMHRARSREARGGQTSVSVT